MQKSKILDIFQAIDRNELRQLRNFVRSPYFNKNDLVVQLGEVWIELARKNFPEKCLKSEWIFWKAFPEEAFDEKRLSHITSDLVKVCERFLAIQALEQDGQAENLYLLKACNTRNLEKSYNRTFKEIQSQLEAPQPLTFQLLAQRHQFAQLIEERFTQATNRLQDPFLQKATDQLDNYYWTQKFRLSCAMLVRQNALNEKYKLRFTTAVAGFDLREIKYSVLLQLYYSAYLLLQSENNKTQLNQLINKIRQEAARLDQKEIRELFYLGINYCTQQIRKGHRDFTAQLLDIYQKGLQEKFLLEEGILSPWNYKNMVKLGLGLKQFDWVESIVESYTTKLPPATQTDAYHYNKADISYHRKDYPSALYHLNQTEFTDIYYTLGAKAMLIKIYFERQDTEALLSLFSSFQLYLKRNRIVGQDTKNAYLNFIRFTKKLHRSHQTENLQTIRQKILRAGAFSNRNWLLTQLDQKLDNEA